MSQSQRKRARVGQVILFKRDASPYWYLKYPDGVREIQTGKHAGMAKRKYRVESTGQTELRRAMVLAQDIDLKLFKGTLGVCPGRITVPQLQAAFLEYQTQDTDNRYRHLRDLRGRIGLFAERTSHKGIGAAAITIEVAELFVRHRRHELRLQDRTVKNYVTAVGSLFAWGQRRQPPRVAENPFACGRNGASTPARSGHGQTGRCSATTS